jgi:hypothetical protein
VELIRTIGARLVSNMTISLETECDSVEGFDIITKSVFPYREALRFSRGEF